MIELDINPDYQGIRRFYGMTKKRMAARIGVSVRTLRYWERGLHQPQDETGDRLRRFLAEHKPEIWIKND